MYCIQDIYPSGIECSIRLQISRHLAQKQGRREVIWSRNINSLCSVPPGKYCWGRSDSFYDFAIATPKRSFVQLARHFWQDEFAPDSIVEREQKGGRTGGEERIRLKRSSLISFSLFLKFAQPLSSLSSPAFWAPPNPLWTSHVNLL